MRTYVKIAGLLTGILFLLNPSLFAQKGMGNSTGIAREFEQPEIELIVGRLDHIKTGPCEHATGYAYIGTHIFIKTDQSDELINIHLGAAYAVKSFVDELEIGEEISIQAFRTDELQPQDFIAKEITTNGRTLQLRDENLRPFWAGSRSFPQNQKFGRRGYRW